MLVPVGLRGRVHTHLEAIRVWQRDIAEAIGGVSQI